MAAPRAITTTVLILATACCRVTPTRPSNVPDTAEWAGGVDGGTWIDCTYKYKEPVVGYECRLFGGHTAQLEAKGLYVLAFLTEGGRDYPADPFSGGAIDSYDRYDGREIRVSRRRILVPDGWIDHPFGDGHGKRVRYERGQELERQSY